MPSAGGRPPRCRRCNRCRPLRRSRRRSSGHVHAPLRGREGLVDELVDVARRAAGGHGSARTLVGEPGVGKTSVLDEVVRRLRSSSPIGFDVVRLKGLEAEVEMAWSGLAGLLDRYLDRVDAPAAGARRRRSARPSP